MLKRVFVVFVLSLLVGGTSMAEVPSLKSQKEKLSYILGLRLGQGATGSGMDLDPKAVAQAVEDVLSGTPPRLTQEQMMTTLREFEAGEAAKQKAAAENNKKRSAEFLAENGKRDGVTITASGLQYEIVRAGDGPKPKATDKVKVHYRGSLIDGTEFDSSYRRGEPATFPVNGVIQGWQEAIQLMPVGSSWKIYIPSEIGYGSRGAGKTIGPDQALVFDVELLEIVAAE